MGLTISSLFSRLFGKKQMRILMGESRFFSWMLVLTSESMLTVLASHSLKKEMPGARVSVKVNI